jgi:hypothetical protein
MAKRKWIKGQTTIYKTVHRKLNENRAKGTPLITRGDLRCSSRVCISCSTCVKYNTLISLLVRHHKNVKAAGKFEYLIKIYHRCRTKISGEILH